MAIVYLDTSALVKLVVDLLEAAGVDPQTARDALPEI